MFEGICFKSAFADYCLAISSNKWNRLGAHAHKKVLVAFVAILSDATHAKHDTYIVITRQQSAR